MKVIVTENRHIEAGIYSVIELGEIMQVIVDAIRNGGRVLTECGAA